MRAFDPRSLFRLYPVRAQLDVDVSATPEGIRVTVKLSRREALRALVLPPRTDVTLALHLGEVRPNGPVPRDWTN